MNFIADFLTNAGPRSENQDAANVTYLDDNSLVVAVADGLGGHEGGEIASELAIKMFVDLVQNGSTDLKSVASQIHLEIRRLQQQTLELRSMATTLSAAILRQGIMEFVHCGDTRIAVARSAGIKKLTTDQTEAQRLYSSGAISKSEFNNYSRKNILESALGVTGNPNIETGRFSLKVHDKIFCSSDGFHNKIYLRELLYLTSNLESPADIVARLGEEMLNRTADDNYSLVVAIVAP